MNRLNVIVTSKPGDGLMHYSFEQVQYLISELEQCPYTPPESIHFHFCHDMPS